MRIRVINPNTTAAMTATIERAAKEAAAAGTEIEAVTSSTGPVSIEGYYDEALCLPGLLMEIRKGEAAGADAHVIACFDDTGLDAARQLAAAPVIGIGEAAYHAATLIAHKFTVVTTLSRSIPALEHNLLKYGFERRAGCAPPRCRCWRWRTRPRMRAAHRCRDRPRAGRGSSRGHRARLRRHGQAGPRSVGQARLPGDRWRGRGREARRDAGERWASRPPSAAAIPSAHPRRSPARSPSWSEPQTGRSYD